MCSSDLLPRDPAILIETIARLRAENEKLHATLGTLKGALYGAHSEWRDTDEAQLALGLVIWRHIPSNPNRTARREESRLCQSLSGRRPRAQHRRRRQDQKTNSHRRRACLNV